MHLRAGVIAAAQFDFVNGGRFVHSILSLENWLFRNDYARG
jgi:hypothetical protein